ncbi:MAG: thioredoxin domain-containing protein [Paludibacteraceae bacterium]|nr:thioredoxin domain-containing protein [Paludibacteraceae bacterium]
MKKIATLTLVFFVACICGMAQKNQEKDLPILTKKKFIDNVWDFTKNKKFKYKGDKPIIIDFNATWCTPCKAIHPSLVELQAEYGDKITIYSIDVDKEPEITDAFKITNIPALVFIKDGKTNYFMSVGKKSKDELKSMIESKLFNNTTIPTKP